MRTTVDLLAGRKDDGEPVFEEVLVDRLDRTRVRIVATPSLVLGIARGDVVEVDPDGAVTRVVERGGYVSLQVYRRRAVEADELAAVNGRGGFLDSGVDGSLIVFAIPAAAGRPWIESFASSLVAAEQDAEWYYGNVYGDDGVTPLGWW